MTNKKYIIACSSMKSVPDNKKTEKNLTFNNELHEHRAQLLYILENSNNHLRVKNNQRISIKKQKINFNNLESANKLYSPGRFFSAANSFNWNQQQCENIYIISALFGIVRADDYLPYYDLAMDDILDDNLRPKNFWKGKLDSLIKIISSEDNQLYNLLSNNYLHSLSDNSINSMLIPDINFLKNDRNSRNIKRGKWLLHEIS